MGFDLFGFVVLIFALIVVAFIQVAAALGIMYAMHMLLRDKLEETTYGQFDFDNFQKPAFYEMMSRLALIFLAPTMVLHVLEYLLVGIQIKRAPVAWRFGLLVLETAVIAAGLVYVLKVDRRRAIILTTASALVYVLLLWGVVYSKLI
jgi:hypothetical protein